MAKLDPDAPFAMPEEIKKLIAPLDDLRRALACSYPSDCWRDMDKPERNDNGTSNSTTDMAGGIRTPDSVCDHA